MRKNNNVGVAISRPHTVGIARKNKGITLIALIITIIVMLILVAVSIRIALSTGLFESAGKAGKDWKTAQDEEQGLASGKVNIGGVWYDSIEDYVNSGNTSSENIKINLSMVNTPVTVTADGTKVSSITEGAPIPVDFYYVGGTMNTGIVISDNSADANKGADAELQGNQFVWVPVLQNQKLKIEVESKEEITEIKVKDALLREITLDNEPSGKSYEAELTPTINGTYTVTVTTGEETVEKTLKVLSLYAQDFHMMTKEEMKADYTLEEFTEDYTDNDGNVVEEWLEEEYGTTSVEEAYELEIQDRYEDDLEWYSKCSDNTIEAHSNSVNTYGGFYIARYEAGSENARTRSSGTTDAIQSKKNKYPYNYINQTNAITQASGMYNKTNVTSSLINAATWDRTLNWLVETNAITANEILDSTSWGNYYNSTFEFTGYYSTDWGDSFTNATSSTSKPVETSYLLGTGVSDYTKRNNIYDLAGNCWEWTTEAISSGRVVNRGGVYDINGTIYPASIRSHSAATVSNSSLAFRAVLYIN